MIKIGLAGIAFGIFHEWLSLGGYVANYGVSFGLFSGVGKWLALVCLILIVWIFRKNSWLVAVGGLINVADRLRFGYVRDYWYISSFSLYNNVADWLVLAGVGLILVNLIWKKSK